MSVIDISNIEYKLVGVCALKGEEKELLKSIWSERFSEHVAFFAEVETGDSALVMAKKIFNTISAAGYKSALGFQVALAVFVDLRDALDEDFLKELSDVSAMLSTHLMCSVKLQLYFGFVGMSGLNGEDVALMRQNASELVRYNPFSKGVYLVGEPAFGGTPEFRWKAVALFLDMIRRDANLDRLLTVNHSNGTIGFLRYGEYDEQLLVKLKSEEKKLIDNLSSNGSVDFPNELNARALSIEAAAREAFVPDAKMQPIHPDMVVSGWWDQRQARHGNNLKFNNARAQTMIALQGTGDSLVKQIQEFYQRQLGDPKQYLVDILTSVHAGIGFVENSELVKSLMKPENKVVSDAMPLALTYNEAGYTQEIGTYLDQKLNYGIAKAKAWFYETLMNAFKEFSHELIAARRREMEEQLHMDQNNLKHVPTMEEFCEQAIGSGSDMDTQFRAIVGASGDMSLKYLVCRKDTDRKWIEQNCFMGNQQESRFYIHETMGGLIKRDDAPVKALHALLFDCTDKRLKEFLR